MYNDVIDLRDFYASQTGRVTRRIVGRYVREIWPDLSGMSLAGIGYAVPYLPPYLEEAARVTAVMPAQQGVIRWPAKHRNLTLLSPEEDLALPDVSIDRVLLVHAVECSEQPRRLLREVWRIMADGGRVLIVVPNRRGLWARFDHTPFGHGHPYTHGQLLRLLRDNLFVPAPPVAALFVPPTRSRLLLGSAPPLEKMGMRWFKTFAGLLLIEAQKQIYAATPALEEKKHRKRSYVRVIGGTEHRSTGRSGTPAQSSLSPGNLKPAPCIHEMTTDALTS